MHKSNFVVLDVETGGFSFKKNPITEIAMVAVDYETLEILDKQQFYIKPYDDLFIDPKALKVTGLKISDIKDGVDKKKAVKMILDFCKKNSKVRTIQNRPIMVGHNVKFDWGFVESLFDRCGKNIKESFVDRDCTMTLAKKANFKRLKLGEICEDLGIELTGAHRAMNDTLATVEVYKYFVQKLRGKSEVKMVNKSTEKERPRARFRF